MVKTLYLNLEDDVTRITNKLKREKGDEVVLVFPKGSFIFSDSINLRLLKKQTDMLGKRVSILTMDEKGQMYAQEAGFELKFLPKTSPSRSVSDIRRRSAVVMNTVPVPEAAPALKPKAVVKKVRKVPRAVVPIAASMAAEQTENIYIPPAAEELELPRRRSYRKFIIGFLSLALIVLIVLVVIVLPSANVKVLAKSQTISRDIDIIADTKAQTVDSSKLTIPATPANETQNLSNTFQTLGKKEVGSKAQGRVAIYNLTGSPINLKAGTTTLTVGSKSYVFTADQGNIKALTSASADSNASVADIIAAEGGESFNLPAGTRMEIANQAFGSQPQRLYAKTVTQVIGGSSRFVSVVSKDDLDQAKDSFTKQVVDSVNAKLKNDNLSLVDGSYTVNVVSFTADKPEGTEAPSFNAQAQITVTGLAVNEPALKDMIRQRLLMSLGSGKSLQDSGSDKISYKQKNIDLTNGIMQLSLHYESNALAAIDPTELKTQIAGKAKAQAGELILSNPDVDSVEITLSPAWQKSMPRFGSKIHLEIQQQ